MNAQEIAEVLGITEARVYEIASALFGDSDELNDEQLRAVELVAAKMQEQGLSEVEEAIAIVAAEQKAEQQRAKAEAQHKAKLDQLAQVHQANQAALRRSALNSGLEKFVEFQAIEAKTFAHCMANGVDPNMLSPELVEALEASQELMQAAMSNYVSDRTAITLEIAKGERPFDLPELPQQPVPLLLGSAQ